MSEKRRILLIDRDQDWLKFAESTLSSIYEVLTESEFDQALRCCIKRDAEPNFDLIFVGLDWATENLDTIRSFSKRWRFVVMFPIIQQGQYLRILFKSGAFDCTDKPNDGKRLLELVKEQIDRAKLLNGTWRPTPTLQSSDSGVERLLEILDLPTNNLRR